jgi:hypothetical protein
MVHTKHNPEFLEAKPRISSESDVSRTYSLSPIPSDKSDQALPHFDGTILGEQVSGMKQYNAYDHPLPALPEVDSGSDASSLRSECVTNGSLEPVDSDSGGSTDYYDPEEVINQDYFHERPYSADSQGSAIPLVHKVASASRDTTSAQAGDSEGTDSTSTSSSIPSHSKRALRKKLTININNSNFNIENRRRPLSPFTKGGYLRSRVQSPMPPSAPAALTLYGPSIQDEVEAKQTLKRLTQKMQKQRSHKTTREARNGASLLAVLGRRIARAQAQAQANVVG